MQRWRTRHDIRGICCQQAGDAGGLFGLGEGVVPNSQGLINYLNPASAGGGLTQGGPNFGLFQVPISLDFLNPSATSTFDPTVYANPTVTQGPLSNTLNVAPLIGGGQDTSSSIFGGGRGGGSGGGNVSQNINYAPTTSLSQNLPNVPGFASMPNMLQGTAQQNIVTPFSPSPLPQMGGGANNIAALMPRPIAAGGYLPMPYPMNQPSSQGGGGQQVIPGMQSPPAMQGTSQQAGGYPPSPPMPPPQQPAAMPSMFSQMLGMGGPGQNYGLQQGQPNLQAETAKPDVSGQSMSLGAGRTVAPDAPIAQSSQDTIDELERLKQQVSPAAAAAIDNYTKSAAAKLAQHAANKAVLEPKLQEAEAKRDAATQKADSAATPEGNALLLQATKKAIYDNKPPAEQAAITRGLNNFKYRGSAHPKLRSALTVAGFLGNTGIAKAARSMETRMQTVEKAEEARDDVQAKQFLTEVHQAMSEQHANLATDLTGSDAAVTDYRTQMADNDSQLRSGIENAGDLYIKPEQLNLEAQGKEASIEEHEGAERARGVQQALAIPKLNLEARNTAASEKRANTGAEALALNEQKNQRDQDKLQGQLTAEQLRNQKLQQEVSANQWTGKFASLKPGTGIKLDQYQEALLDRVKSGEIDGATAKEANRKAKIILKEE